MGLEDGQASHVFPELSGRAGTDSQLIGGQQVLHSLQRLVCRHRPDCVLLGGDIVDDMFCPAGLRDTYWRVFSEFGIFLRRHGVPALAVRGNKDDVHTYEQACQQRGIRDISEQLVELDGLRLLGVSHAATEDLRYMRRLALHHRDPIDIVLAHAAYKRRPWLLMLNTQMLITGHFDTRLCIINGTALLSMWSSPFQYALVQTRGRNWRMNLYASGRIHVQQGDHRRPTTQKIRLQVFSAFVSRFRGRLRCSPQPQAIQALAYRRDYAAEIAALINARARVKRGLTSRVQEQRRLVDLGLPKSHVAELLAGTPAHGQTREGNSGDAELV